MSLNRISVALIVVCIMCTVISMAGTHQPTWPLVALWMVSATSLGFIAGLNVWRLISAEP